MRLLTVLVATASRRANRWYLVYGSSDTGSWGETYGGVISSVVNAIQIQVLNAIYKKMAVALTGKWSTNGGKTYNLVYMLGL